MPSFMRCAVCMKCCDDVLSPDMRAIFAAISLARKNRALVLRHSDWAMSAGCIQSGYTSLRIPATDISPRTKPVWLS